MIRMATRGDAPAILDIYAPYIRETAITFEYDVPSLGAFMERFDVISARYPWIVWEENGKVLGYAYASECFSRAAYAWDVDMSIYLHMEARGRKIGSKLYGCLEEMLRIRGYHNLYALITADNIASAQFHEHRGYELLGNLKQSGFKFAQWYDVLWYGLRLCPAENPGSAPDKFECRVEDRAIMERYS